MTGGILGIIVFAVLALFDRKTCAAAVGDWMSWICMVVVGAMMSLSFMTAMKALDCRTLRSIGNHTLGIMLLHKFVVVTLELNSMKPFMLWNYCGGTCGVLVVTVLATTFAFAGSWCVRKYCPVLLGDQRMQAVT